jgi:hypothetical protein
MVIENLVFDFDSKTGDALPFKADAKRIRKVTISASTINFTNSNGAIGAAGTTDQVDKSQKAVQETKKVEIESDLHVAWDIGKKTAKSAKGVAVGLIRGKK